MKNELVFCWAGLGTGHETRKNESTAILNRMEPNLELAIRIRGPLVLHRANEVSAPNSATRRMASGRRGGAGSHEQTR